MPRTLFAATAALALAATAPLAQQTASSITGTLGLDAAQWRLTAPDDGPQSGWRETETGRVLHMVGRPFEGAGDDDDLLSITIRTTGGGDAVAAEAVEIRYAPADGPEVMASGPNADLTLTAFDLSDDELAVSGDLVATMTPGGADELIVEPGEDAVTFDGNFQATLIRQDD
ncbi:hypothetical protein P1J78_08115 [Psychromarinibacter sp. C21-152]|uniref:Uncharacterized protein n=1 Tax=Psychromarinibacter sediminicola TaxID=3033385 RepID=A0AAE3NRI9_9RHOB|nr:hypothetical protein [Psychromarinibacter sediminicola]MDF0600691.1 hypothetical protein [Psychromarinibacter sediminicola]